SVGAEARDLFLIGHADGRKVQPGADQDLLRLAVALIKQFTQVLPYAPDPARALRYFDQLLDRLMANAPEALGVLIQAEGLRELARLLGSSGFLWEDFLRLQFEHLLPVLGEWRTRPLLGRAELRPELRERLVRASGGEAIKQALNAFKDEQMLVIDMKH